MNPPDHTHAAAHEAAERALAHLEIFFGDDPVILRLVAREVAHILSSGLLIEQRARSRGDL
jgi:hypothetical protein